MNCKKCGADIDDESAMTCPNCGASISKSSKNRKVSVKAIIMIAFVIILILGCSFLFLQQATQKSQIESEFGGHNINGEGTDFTIKAILTHENMFGAVIIEDEEMNATIKDDSGKTVNKLTLTEEKWQDLGNLPVGHYTIELSYKGDFPSANSTRDFTVVSAEDYAKKT